MNRSELFRSWQSCGSPVVVTDSDGRVIFSNAAAEKRLGITVNSLQPCFLWSAFPDAPQLEIESHFRTLPPILVESSKTAEEFQIKGQHCCPIPIIFPEDVTLFTGWLFILRPGENESTHENRVVRALASGIAHDFNNILTGIISHLDLALSGPELPEGARESFRYAQASARQGSELANTLLTFGHRPAPKTSPLLLNPLIEDVIARLHKTTDPRIKIQILPEELPPFWVEAEEAQLRQMFLTLSINARDSMLRGGELTFILQEVFTPSKNVPHQSGLFVKVTVKDTGEGLPASALPHIFEPYFCSKTLGKGSGLGLASVNNIATSHGGWVEVESEIGQGSQFHIYLPISQFPAPLAERSLPSPEEESASLQGSESILVVDDENLVRTIIKAVLSYRGYQVREAASGKEAIQLYEETLPRFDLVLLDAHLPDMPGWEVLKRLQAVDPHLVYIFLSGEIEESLREKCSQLEHASYLSKPFDNQALLRIVREKLNASQR